MHHRWTNFITVYICIVREEEKEKIHFYLWSYFHHHYQLLNLVLLLFSVIEPKIAIFHIFSPASRKGAILLNIFIGPHFFLLSKISLCISLWNKDSPEPSLSYILKAHLNWRFQHNDGMGWVGIIGWVCTCNESTTRNKQLYQHGIYLQKQQWKRTTFSSMEPLSEVSVAIMNSLKSMLPFPSRSKMLKICNTIAQVWPS